jgi:rubrerythrin
MSVCKRLHIAKDDEANGVLEYVKLKDLMSSEHKEHIDIIENIIIDESRHLEEILLILKESKCPELTTAEEICILAKDIYDKTEKIKRLSGYIINIDERKKVHDIAEDIESGIKQLKTIANLVKK